MLIWALFAAMTAVAALIVLVPLMRRAQPAPSQALESGDVSVYRDQLGEIDRDLDDGLVAPVEAEAARAEIARRLLRAARRADEAGAAPIDPAVWRPRIVVVAAIVVLPLVALTTYLALGRPDLHDRPLAERQVARPESQSIDDLVVRVEAHLAQNPDDVRGWDVLGPVYMRLDRMEEAAAAFTTAIRLGGPTPKRQDGLGEALTIAASGIVTAEARAAFETSLTLEPRGVLPRMYLALALYQEGRGRESAEAWRAVVALGSGDEAWLPTARAELAKAEALAAGTPAANVPPPSAAAPNAAAPGAPAPSAADIDAAAQMSPEKRAELIEGMVARLADRLATSGGTIDEWERLIRSQKSLGRAAEARAALDRAKTALAGDAPALARLDALAATLAP